MGNARVIVVMPALNAARTLKEIVNGIPTEYVDDIILVDDHSSDETVELAHALGLSVVWHPHNVGYGGNQKTCYMESLRRDADVVVMLHPDGQYEPELIPEMVAPIVLGEADVVLGSRFMEPGMARRGGMPLYKYLANRFLTTIENFIMGTKLTELHTGYRAYSREVLLTVPFLRNSIDFSFDSEFLMQARQVAPRNAGVDVVSQVPARVVRHDPETGQPPLVDMMGGATLVVGAFHAAVLGDRA